MIKESVTVKGRILFSEDVTKVEEHSVIHLLEHSRIEYRRWLIGS
jgi:hypothetical protein